jgi:hypothetical protein
MPFTSIAGEKYVAIGTSQGLFLYYEGEFYDITPIDNDVITGADFDATSGSQQQLPLIKHLMDY